MEDLNNLVPTGRKKCYFSELFHSIFDVMVTRGKSDEAV